MLHYQLICTWMLETYSPGLMNQMRRKHLRELKAPQPCESHALTLLLWWPAQRTLQAAATDTQAQHQPRLQTAACLPKGRA